MFGRASRTVLSLVSRSCGLGFSRAMPKCLLTEVASAEQLYAFNYTLPPSAASSSKSHLPPVTKTPRIVSSPLSSKYANDPDLDPETPPPGAISPSSTGWSVYNPRTEFSRQGVGSRTRAWRFTDINRDYMFSPTYPAKLVVPSRIGDALLQYAAKYRSKARIPALTYLHWANNVRWLSLTSDDGLISRHPSPGLPNRWSV